MVASSPVSDMAKVLVLFDGVVSSALLLLLPQAISELVARLSSSSLNVVVIDQAAKKFICETSGVKKF